MRALAIVLLLGGFAALPVRGAEDGPVPPCAGASRPSYPAAPGSPEVRAWYADELGGNWGPPACTGWAAGKAELVLAVAARFDHRAGAIGLLARIAAVSRLEQIRYWSVTRRRWRDLVSEARALSGPDRRLRRPDFAVEELQPGRDLYFWQRVNSPASSGVYRLRFRERAERRLVFEVENVEPMGLPLLGVVGPGQYQILFFLERESQAVWRYYSLARAGAVPGPSPRLLEASYVNRALAIFRHLAGLPGEQATPAAP